jgi:CBS domain-containing protein
MGDFRVRTIDDAEDRANMLKHVLDDIDALEKMLGTDYFGDVPIRIGAEQELCIVDNESRPALTNLQLLKEINDPHYTHELALFNLEANLDPHVLEGTCFSEMESQLLQLLAKGHKAASSVHNNLLLTGILPTLKFRHLQFEYITPIPRYYALSKVLGDLRGSDFEIYIQGVDDLNLSLESMLFEACNTSFQMHLQIHPDEFVEKYNWAQMIAGPVLAVGANSPLLFGNELWAETRIAVFKQSIDTRSSSNQMRKKTPRVFFGENWLHDSPINLFREEVARFPIILTSDAFDWSTVQLDNGLLPELRAIKIHNGTTYTWNRICYGTSEGQPHLRIECRYLPAGPSPIDEIANFAFWIGLMQGQSEELKGFWHKLDFKVAKSNFLKAARYGTGVTLEWFGKQYTIDQLVLQILIPIARKGLEKFNVDARDINKYLSIIEQRMIQNTNGADWQIRNYRNLQGACSSASALQKMTSASIEYQKLNIPIHQWKDISINDDELVKNKDITVEEVMGNDLFTIHEEDGILFASALCEWHNTSYLPVENLSGELIGLLTDGMISSAHEKNYPEKTLVKDLMIREVFSINPQQSIVEAREIMKAHNIGCLPVINFRNKLMGLITLEAINNL